MPARGEPLPGGAEQLFAGHPESLAVYRRVRRVVDDLGGAEERVTRSQVSWRRGRGFAFLWRPGQYVSSTVPAVLSVALPHEAGSRRVKEVAHPSPATWVHHVELTGPVDVDDEVTALLREAYDAAAPTSSA